MFTLCSPYCTMHGQNSIVLQKLCGHIVDRNCKLIHCILDLSYNSVKIVLFLFILLFYIYKLCYSLFVELLLTILGLSFYVILSSYICTCLPHCTCIWIQLLYIVKITKIHIVERNLTYPLYNAISGLQMELASTTISLRLS